LDIFPDIFYIVKNKRQNNILISHLFYICYIHSRLKNDRTDKSRYSFVQSLCSLTIL